MREVKGSVEIDAPVEKVWAVVTDFASYPKWNPFIVELTGELKPGVVCTVVTRSTKGKEMKFPSKVVEVKDKEKLLFKGTPKKGLISSDHYFIFEPLDSGKTKFSQSIAFTGIMVPMAGSAIGDAQKGLDMMNGALKENCEK